MLKKFYIFLGPPGAGKGTFSSLCIKHLGWLQVSMGNLCRKEIAKKSDIGREIDFLIKGGRLVPDDLALEMLVQGIERKIAKYMANSVNIKEGVNIILDGFPRLLSQAEKLEGVAPSQNLFRDAEISLVRMCLGDDAVIKRLVNRVICSNSECQEVYSLIDSALAPNREMFCDLCEEPLVRREDDVEEVARERLKHYYSQEKALLDFYKSRGNNIMELFVDRLLNETFNDFKCLVEEVKHDKN